MTGLVVWMTGMSGAGKSTISQELASRVTSRGVPTCVLDGDALRAGLCDDLGFSVADRAENVRRTGEVARLLVSSGFVAIVALISPTRAGRDRVRTRIPDGRFVEVFVNAPLAVCERRDVKGLYARARRGELRDFTGVSAPYEPPEQPEVEIRTDQLSVSLCVERILDYLEALPNTMVQRAAPEA